MLDLGSRGIVLKCIRIKGTDHLCGPTKLMLAFVLLHMQKAGFLMTDSYYDFCVNKYFSYGFVYTK